ncbi:MAG: hypothetical protein EA425_17610 [Puniceicoccaceae bacterium]|nr:MAG: hypothetical protein EA425_17610 [Puniceicoccaceae bacterium]
MSKSSPNRRLPAVSLAFLLLAFAPALQARSATEESFSIRPHGPDTVLRISNSIGPLLLEAWDGETIELLAVKSASNDNALEAIELTIRESEKAITLETSMEPVRTGLFRRARTQGTVDLTVRVPAGMMVENASTTNGSISLAGIARWQRIAAVNGRVDVDPLSENGRISTVNGRVTVRHEAHGKLPAVRISTVNGAVVAHLSPKATGEIRTSTVNGRVRDERDAIREHGEGGPVRISTVNGAITIHPL